MKETINSFIELGDKVVEQEEEIERLNNIINELEKILIIEISEAGFRYEKIKEDTLQWIFNELQELKGSNENE